MKNCKDCIKNNRKPDAVGCLQCSVNKSRYEKIEVANKEEVEAKSKEIIEKYRDAFTELAKGGE